MQGCGAKKSLFLGSEADAKHLRHSPRYTERSSRRSLLNTRRRLNLILYTNFRLSQSSDLCYVGERVLFIDTRGVLSTDMASGLTTYQESIFLLFLVIFPYVSFHSH